MYKWKGMKKLSLEEVKIKYEHDEIGDLYFLYPDDTESHACHRTWEDIVRHYESGGEFGIEK